MIKVMRETGMQMGGRDANMCEKITSIYLNVIASMHKVRNKRSIVGIGIIHNTKENDMSKHMGHQVHEMCNRQAKVEDNPNIMCTWCSEDSVALNTMERASVHLV